MSKLWQNVAENAMFVLEFLGIIIGLFLLAAVLENLGQKKNGKEEKSNATRKMVTIGILTAMSTVLMMLEFPIPFTPPFYKIDFSEVPILLGAFVFGPASGVMMEFMKILLKLVFKGTSTAFVGELANFAIGCSFVVPAAVIYWFKKTKKTAIVSCAAGTLIRVVFGCVFNGIYLLPAFAKMFHMPLEALLEMGKVNPLMTEGSMISFLIVCVAPMNLVKGLAASLAAIFVYKPLSRYLKK